MKPKGLILLFLILCSVGFAGERRASIFEGSVSLLGGSILFGEQIDLLKNGLTPTPETVNDTMLNVQLSYFPIRFLGLEAGTNMGIVSAVSYQTYSPLNCYNIFLNYGGIAFRWFIKHSARLASSITLSAGATYTILQYNEDLKSLFSPSFYFYDVKPDFGFYGKVAYNFYFTKHFFVSMHIQSTYSRTYIDVTNILFDGHHLLFGATIGFAI